MIFFKRPLVRNVLVTLQSKINLLYAGILSKNLCKYFEKQFDIVL